MFAMGMESTCRAQDKPKGGEGRCGTHVWRAGQFIGRLDFYEQRLTRLAQVYSRGEIYLASRWGEVESARYFYTWRQPILTCLGLSACRHPPD